MEKLLLLCWVFLHVTSFVLPLAFSSGLQNHSTPWRIIGLIYIPLHVGLQSLLFSAMHSEKVRIRVTSFIMSTLVQSVFCFVSFWIATCWFISLAPMISDEATEIVPSFIWADLQSSELLKWVLNVSDPANNMTWASCNLSNTEITNFTLDYSW